MYGNHMAPFNGSDLGDHQLHSPSLTQMHIRASSPGRSESSMNGDRHLDVPQTYEQLIAANSSLKTRVSELEVINELFRGRVTQLEQDEANARRGEEMRRGSERTLRQHLEESQRRENQLKRRLDDLEAQVAEMSDDNEGRHKKIRLEVSAVGESEVSTPASAT
jgi:GATA-binding protein